MIYDELHLRARSSFWTMRIMTVISALSVLPGWLSTACHLLVSPDSGLYTINYHGMFGEDTTVLLAGEHKSDWRGPGPAGKSVPGCGWNQIFSMFSFRPLWSSSYFVFIVRDWLKEWLSVGVWPGISPSSGLAVQGRCCHLPAWAQTTGMTTRSPTMSDLEQTLSHLVLKKRKWVY